MVDIFISGPEGRIEARYLPPRNSTLPVVAVLHPHSLKGGRMDNDVVQTMSRAFHEQGFGTLRFNFRGVGNSEGVFSGGEGELNDAAAALDWLQSSQHIAHRLWVAGFSFGAWIAMQLLMRRPEIENFVVASPQAYSYDFNFLAPCPVSGQIIYGENDKVTPKVAVDGLVSKLSAQKGLYIDYKVIEEANHSFDGKLEDLNRIIQTYVSNTMASQTKMAS